MTNPTRTRAAIQAYQYYLPIKAFDQKCEWIGVKTYAGGTLFPLTFQVHESKLIPAADLIPRAEHEAAVKEATPAKLDANTALKYLVKEYDLDTGHMDTARPRTYPFDHNGHIYEVVVRRKGEVAAPQAVAPVGIHNAVREVEWSARILNEFDPDRYGSEDFAARLTYLTEHVEDLKHATVGKITELPPPSDYWRERIEYFADIDSIEINCGIYGKLKLRSYQVRALCGCLLALLESEGDHD